MVSVTQRKAGSMGKGELLDSGKFNPHSSKIKNNFCWISTTLFVKVVCFQLLKIKTAFQGLTKLCIQLFHLVLSGKLILERLRILTPNFYWASSAMVRNFH